MTIRGAALFILALCSVPVIDAGAQTIALSTDSLAFSGMVGGPNPPPQTISITNTGAGALTWRIARPTAPWLVVSPPRGGAPLNVSFAVNLAGLPVGSYLDTVIVASNDPASPTTDVVVTLTVGGPNAPVKAPGGPGNPPPAGGGPYAEYEVELRFTGYSGLAKSKDCDALANPAGYDVLTGTLRGDETPQPDEDVVYTGTLKRSTAMDYCEARPAPTVDQLAWCIATLTGSAVMDVEITVYGEADRGAWVKANPGIGPAQGAVRGSCTPADMLQIQQDYPSGESGGSPDGQPIEDGRSTIKFVVGSLGRLRVGNYPAVPPTSIWTLRVIKKIR